MDVELETARKDRLLDLFIKLEQSERSRMKGAQMRYEKMFRGVAEVASVQKSTARLVRENGKKIRPFEITPEIAPLLRKGDWLGMTAGLNLGTWRLISLDVIGTAAAGNKMHISFPNRQSEAPEVH